MPPDRNSKPETLEFGKNLTLFQPRKPKKFTDLVTNPRSLHFRHAEERENLSSFYTAVAVGGGLGARGGDGDVPIVVVFTLRGQIESK